LSFTSSPPDGPVVGYTSSIIREGKGREGKGREGKGREGKGREGKGREGKGREGKGMEGNLASRRIRHLNYFRSHLDRLLLFPYWVKYKNGKIFTNFGHEFSKPSFPGNSPLTYNPVLLKKKITSFPF
jgi:hypothetical protein